MEIDSQPKLCIQSSSEEDEDCSVRDVGFYLYGCSHYRRRCKIRAPCCDEIFSCRLCHNEAKDVLQVPVHERHVLPRHDLEKVICSLCDTEQDVQQICINCGVCMGKYFCSICKLLDDDVSKKQYHCDKCGICRTGGMENYFHCDKCGCCYANMLKDSHNCVERAMHSNCPVCYEYLFDTTKPILSLRCGHSMHAECVKAMQQNYRYTCPICSKSYCDMSRVWERLDREVASTRMPEQYQNMKVWILCNDCGERAEVNFHILAHKCVRCSSYNTRQIQRSSDPCSSRISEMVR